MKPLQAIQTATINVAELLGETGLMGELVSGAFADIIVVKENPLNNIKTLGNVKRVMENGLVWKN